MKIVVYCQHVLGMGHFFRTLEMVRELHAHDVILVTGGSTVPVMLPGHVTHVPLPGLMMDASFSTMYTVEEGRSVDAVREERSRLFLDLVTRNPPDLLVVELYPFGRKAFRFELDPVLEVAGKGGAASFPVVCSLRDILVEKRDAAAYEERVVTLLNQRFDALLVHSDPRMIRLDRTFSRCRDIQIPVVYTGYITPVPDSEKAAAFRKRYLEKGRKQLVVVSAGGGSVGAELLKASAIAHGRLPDPEKTAMVIFTGPHMEKGDVEEIRSLGGAGVRVESFTEDFVSLLSGADLSISLAGYNTCMNIMAAGVPSLVMPFDENREQRLRVGDLANFADMTLLEPKGLSPLVLADLMAERLDGRERTVTGNFRLDLDGAVFTRHWIEERYGQ